MPLRPLLALAFIGLAGLVSAPAGAATCSAPTSGLALRDATTMVQNEAITPSGGLFLLDHLAWGWNPTTGQPQTWAIDANCRGAVSDALAEQLLGSIAGNQLNLATNAGLANIVSQLSIGQAAEDTGLSQLHLDLTPSGGFPIAPSNAAQAHADAQAQATAAGATTAAVSSAASQAHADAQTIAAAAAAPALPATAPTLTNQQAQLTAEQAISAGVGAQADATYSGSGSGSVIGVLKGLFARLAGVLSISGSVSVTNLPATQAVQGVAGGTPVPVSMSAPATGAATSANQQTQITAEQAIQANTAALATAAGQATAHTDAASLIAATSGRVLPLGAEAVSAIGSASGTATGASHDVGGPVGSSYAWAYFNAVVYSDQTGTVEIDYSADNSSFYPEAAGLALTAATPLVLQLPVVARYYRVKVTNGSTAETVLRIADGFSGS